MTSRFIETFTTGGAALALDAMRIVASLGSGASVVFLDDGRSFNVDEDVARLAARADGAGVLEAVLSEPDKSGALDMLMNISRCPNEGGKVFCGACQGSLENAIALLGGPAT